MAAIAAFFIFLQKKLIMSIAIRYFSKYGHSAAMADVIGQVTNTKPETVATPIDCPVDTLFIGAGVFLGKVDNSIGIFIKSLKPDKVRRVVCFGSCAIIKSPVPQMRQMLEAQGITVDERSFTCHGSMGPIHHGHPNKQDLDELRKFTENILAEK